MGNSDLHVLFTEQASVKLRISAILHFLSSPVKLFGAALPIDVLADELTKYRQHTLNDKIVRMLNFEVIGFIS